MAKPIITPINKRRYKVEEDFPFTVEGIDIVIPKGFMSDGGTIPRFFWAIVGSPFQPSIVEAAIIHDYLIAIGYDGEIRDREFYRRLIKNKHPKWKSKLMYWAVVLYRKATD